jgi:hypothetical protein
VKSQVAQLIGDLLMSADNGIYILKSPKSIIVKLTQESDFEYRVIMAGGIDNIYNEEGSIDPTILIEFFGDCKIMSAIDSSKEAIRISQENTTEYGIMVIETPLPFECYSCQSKKS